MGQYLALGLATEIVAPLDDIRKGKFSKEELRQEIERSLLFDMELFSLNI
ncbi:MAG: hypothetical protein FWG84_06585 [Bacteroidales bacterium]|nr:hypothetical protein [Bacteroidales bacterium]